MDFPASGREDALRVPVKDLIESRFSEAVSVTHNILRQC